MARLLGAGHFVLADLAAGFGDRQGDTARVACTGIDDRQRVTKAAAVGRFASDMDDVSVRERDAPNGRSPTHCCTSSWLILFLGLNDKNAEKDASSALY